jgi:hypothetical protein
MFVKKVQREIGERERRITFPVATTSHRVGGDVPERTSMVYHSNRTLSSSSSVSSYGKLWIAKYGACSAGPDACQLCAENVHVASVALYFYKFRTWNNPV